MILIKDRHLSIARILCSVVVHGKYDTYKGSTRKTHSSFGTIHQPGKYDTYKGSTRVKHF